MCMAPRFSDHIAPVPLIQFSRFFALVNDLQRALVSYLHADVVVHKADFTFTPLMVYFAYSSKEKKERKSVIVE